MKRTVRALAILLATVATAYASASSPGVHAVRHHGDVV
jgi:hypothetical protein